MGTWDTEEELSNASPGPSRGWLWCVLRCAVSSGSSIVSSEGMIIIKLIEVSQVLPHLSAFSYEDAQHCQIMDLGLGFVL